MNQGVTAAVNMWDLLTDDDPGHVTGTVGAAETKAKRKKKNKNKNAAVAAAADDDGEVVAAAAANAPAAKAEVARGSEAAGRAAQISSGNQLLQAEASDDDVDGGAPAAGGSRSPCLTVVGEMLKAVVAAGLVAFFYAVVTALTTV